ncbi:hypothetical protein L1987_02943 [Smallanthus sonchifolius]|uniref:Uncharacterized protein n=1 Tax=Smallanthus sonchifolius TaxID=185202 RepID=A0ACB9K9D6_9ASTR|nr:hypothetical protein L1987_02943 [Smallanthus sonchifolius]
MDSDAESPEKNEGLRRGPPNPNSPWPVCSFRFYRAFSTAFDDKISIQGLGDPYRSIRMIILTRINKAYQIPSNSKRLLKALL